MHDYKMETLLELIFDIIKRISLKIYILIIFGFFSYNYIQESLDYLNLF